MEPKTLGIHHIALKACGLQDYEKLISFYRDILGMPVVREWGNEEKKAAMLDTGAGCMELFSDGQEYPGQGAIRHFALAVKDVDECVAAVRAKGYEITVEPKDIVLGSNPGLPARIAFCIGPVGEEVEFFAEK